MASKRIPYATEQGIFSRSREFLRKNRETNRHNSDRSMTSAETPGVEVRIKRVKGAPMHLKSYQIDGRMLRTGAANFSASGLKRQDNDLIVIETAEAAAAFKHNFETRFATGELLSQPRARSGETLYAR
jgi:phosphatidylserine/phosphatidylglycerophosphate/cardiolipin synthase-like enzyme